MLKYNGIGHFHSLAEYFNAALLEGDWRVDIYVPQPFRLYFGREIYIPDIYYVREGQRFVGELKPGGEFDEALHAACRAYFTARGMTFEVIDNESILERAMLAQNWLTVVRFLLTYEELNTERARLAVLQQLLNNGGELTFGEITDLGHRSAHLAHELAVHRMLHSGEIQADFEQQFFSMNTVLQLC